MGFSEDLDKAMRQADWRCVCGLPKNVCGNCGINVEVVKRRADPNFQQDDVAPGGINVVNKTKFVLEFPRFVWTDDEDEIDDIMRNLERLGVPKDALTWFKPGDELTDAIMIAEDIRGPYEFVFCIYEATSAGGDAMRAMLEPYERTTVSMTRKECSEAQDVIAHLLAVRSDAGRTAILDEHRLIFENLLERLSDCD